MVAKGRTRVKDANSRRRMIIEVDKSFCFTDSSVCGNIGHSSGCPLGLGRCIFWIGKNEVIIHEKSDF